MKAKNFDKKFDRGESVLAELDLAKAVRPEHEQRRATIDVPTGIVKSLDKEAQRLGVTRQSIIKVWMLQEVHARM